MLIDGFVIAQLAGDALFGFGTLFAIINPYGLPFVFLDRTAGLTDAERARIARTIATYAFVVLVVSLFAGGAILGFFGISLPALRIAGGLVVAVAANRLLVPVVDPVSEALDVSPAVLLVVVLVVLLALICIQLSISISGMQEQNRRLAERIALLQRRLEETTGEAP